MIYPESVKMYQDLKKTFWWSDMNMGIGEFIEKCLTYQ